MIDIYSREIKDLLSKKMLSEAEEIWLQMLDEDPADIEIFIAFSKEFEKQCHNKEAYTLLAMSVPHLIEHDQITEAIQVIKRMAELMPNDAEASEKITGYYKEIYAQFPSIDKIIEVARLQDPLTSLPEALKNFDVLTAFKVDDFCKHNSWGIGRIKNINFRRKQVTIDFYTKKNHSMDLGLAVDVLIKIDADHISALKYKDIKTIQELADSAPVELLKIVLKSFPDNQATLDDITHSIANDVIGEKNWKKWWDKTKNLIKNDQYIINPEKQKRTYRLLDTPISMDTKVLKKYQGLTNASDKLTFVTSKLKKQRQEMLSEEALTEIATDLNTIIEDSINHHQSRALEAFYTLLCLAPQFPQATEITQYDTTSIFSRFDNIVTTVAGIEKNDFQRQALQDIKKLYPTQWMDIYLDLLPKVQLELIDDIIEPLLEHDENEPKIQNVLHIPYDLIGDAEDLLLWIAKHLWSKKHSHLLTDFNDITILEKLIDLMDLHLSGVIETNDRIVNRIKDLISKNQNAFIVKLLKSSPKEAVLHVAKTIIDCSSLDKLDKQTILAKFIMINPKIKDLMKTEEVKSNVIYSSQDAIEGKQKELDHIINVLIPQNARNISTAREHGDLRENFEYKAAKEEQARLMQRKGELENMLTRVRSIDLNHIDPKRVSIGTKITVTDVLNNTEKQLTIMGIWDSNPSQGVISYLAPLAQCLIGKEPGDEAVLETTEEKYHYKVVTIATAK